MRQQFIRSAPLSLPIPGPCVCSLGAFAFRLMHFPRPSLLYIYIFLKETGNVQFVFYRKSLFLFVYAGFNPFAAHNRICSMTSCPSLFLSIHLPVGRIDLMGESTAGTFLYKLLNLDYRSAGTGGRAPTRQVKERGERLPSEGRGVSSFPRSCKRETVWFFFSVFLQLFIFLNFIEWYFSFKKFLKLWKDGDGKQFIRRNGE